MIDTVILYYACCSGCGKKYIPAGQNHPYASLHLVKSVENDNQWKTDGSQHYCEECINIPGTMHLTKQ